MEEKAAPEMPETLSPCSSGRRSGCDNASPEFEFWMVRNPSFPQTQLLSADELFSDGILRPLKHLRLQPDNLSDDPPDNPISQQPKSTPAETATTTTTTTTNEDPLSESGPELESGPKLTLDLADKSVGGVLTGSKRWKDIFKKTEKKKPPPGIAEEKEKKRERKAGGGASPAELNINIWPFSRSRSAGNGGSRPRVAAATRKVSSAPCSRSNSAGESKSRKWPSSPSRGGVHLGRSSPVWQARRVASGVRNTDQLGVRNIEKGVQKDGNEAHRKKSPLAVAGGGDAGKAARALNLNVQSCIGYRQHLSCRSDESSAVSIAAVAGGGSGCQSGGVGAVDGGRGGNLFNIRNLFSKKVY